MKLTDFELYAWMGEDEFGSGEVGLKRGICPAGYVPMVAIRRNKVEQFAPQMEAMARLYGNRISLVRFQAVEVVRETVNGEESTR